MHNCPAPRTANNAKRRSLQLYSLHCKWRVCCVYCVVRLLWADPAVHRYLLHPGVIASCGAKSTLVLEHLAVITATLNAIKGNCTNPRALYGSSQRQVVQWRHRRVSPCLCIFAVTLQLYLCHWSCFSGRPPRPRYRVLSLLLLMVTVVAELAHTHRNRCNRVQWSAAAFAVRIHTAH